MSLLSLALLGLAAQAAPPAQNTLSLGDVDGDGLVDVVAVSAAGTLSLHANRGEGRFEHVTSSATPHALTEVRRATARDEGGDGRDDLVLEFDSGATQVLRSLGSWTFAGPPTGSQPATQLPTPYPGSGFLAPTPLICVDACPTAGWPTTSGTPGRTARRGWSSSRRR